MLPSVPKSFGRLSEAYLSCYLAVTGKINPLGLDAKQSYALILVDGMGVANIRSAGAHAGFLNSKLVSAKTLFAGFPTTTSSALTSLATAVPNGEHGILGYRVYDREQARAINFLNDLGPAPLESRRYQPLQTVSERASDESIRTVTIGRAEYQASGFTQATMPESQYLSADQIEERFDLAIAELRTPGTLVYLYVPELDQLAHRFGSKSQNWLERIEQLDSILRDFSSRLPKSAAAVVTADHGIIDIEQTGQIYLDEFESMREIQMVGGDPRVPFLYFPVGTDLSDKRVELEKDFGSVAEVAAIAELVNSGWLAKLSATAQAVAPDLVLVPKREQVFYHRGFAKSKSLEMIGQHGGMLKAEWEVPLIRL
jgi:predicted AlkP superfamily pyrophosphatase or phosphodiesterase